MAATPRRQAPARAGVAALPRALRDRLGEPERFLPSRRSLVVGLGLVVLAGAAYAAARETSAFALQRVDVRGAPPAVRAQVSRSLASLHGTSLLAVDGGAVERRVESLPTVVSATYDRAFPHTLRVVVVAERPVAVLRRGKLQWLVSARGRVIERLAVRDRLRLPRIWVPTATAVAVGGFLRPATGGTVARALALVAGFPARPASAAVRRGTLFFRMRSGLEVRLGAPNDIRLKLAIVRRALPLLPSGSTYLDVSVPGRPVAGTQNPQLSSRG